LQFRGSKFRSSMRANMGRRTQPGVIVKAILRSIRL
jgi:hypothetical protein